MKNTTRLKKPQVPKIGDLLSFDDLQDRPKYAGEMMTSATSIPSYESVIDDAHSMVVAEAEARTLADVDLQEQIDAIVASSDVKDIVSTYAELEAYDTTKLGDKDIIKVLADETYDDAESYYRWSTSAEEFSYIGSVGPYYTQAETDSLIGEKQDILTAGDNVSISAENVISATDTTYTAGDNVSISAENVISTIGGGIKTLTTADYNYPATGTKTGVAAWLLNSGVYKVKSGITLMLGGNQGSIQPHQDGFLFVGRDSTPSNYASITYLGNGLKSSVTNYTTSGLNQAQYNYPSFDTFTILTAMDVVDDLTYNYNYAKVLSAKQGRVLNNNIGQLSSLTTTTKTSTVAAINELVTKIGNVESALHAINNGGNA